MAIGDVYRTSIEGLYDGQLCVMTCHYVEFSDSAQSPIENATQIATTLRTRFTANLLPLLNENYNLTQVVANQIVPAIGPSFISATSGVVAGESTGDGLPGTVALVISRYSGTASRAGRGRVYVPAISEGDTTMGRLNGPLQIQFQEAAEDTWGLVSAGLTDYHFPCIHSATLNPILAVVVSWTCRRILGNQRRRRIGVGA